MTRLESVDDPSSSNSLPSVHSRGSKDQRSLRGTLILILNPPENHADMDLIYEIVIEVCMFRAVLELICGQTNIPIFDKPRSRVQRKYTHFAWLRRQLRTRFKMPRPLQSLPHRHGTRDVLDSLSLNIY